MPLSHIFRKCTAGYRLSRLQENINHLMYLDDIKLFTENKKIGNSNIRCDNIQSGYRDRIWLRKLRHAKNEKRQMTHDRRNGTSKSGKNLNFRRKGKLQILRHLGG